jgi:hypothetical protein
VDGTLAALVLERVPDRFLTARTARAITSPSAILLAGAGAAVAIVGGLPLAGAAGVGAAAWLVRVAVALPRRRRGERIDPYTLGEPWRHYVLEAQSAEVRYQRAVTTTEPGPLQERLNEIGARIATGVRECWRIARRADALQGALRDLDVERTGEELARLEEEGRSPSAAATAEALRAQLTSAQRMSSVVRDARDQLRLLDARLDEAVTRAVELALRTGRDAELGGLGSDVDQLVLEMESLRSALDEAGGGPRDLPQAGTGG